MEWYEKKSLKLIFVGLILLMFSTNLFSQKSQQKEIIDNLSRGIWTFVPFENLVDTLQFFRDGKFKSYDSEMDNIFYGHFFIKKDTVITVEDSAQFMHEFSGAISKYIYKDSILTLIYVNIAPPLQIPVIFKRKDIKK